MSEDQKTSTRGAVSITTVSQSFTNSYGFITFGPCKVEMTYLEENTINLNFSSKILRHILRIFLCSFILLPAPLKLSNTNYTKYSCMKLLK